VALETVVQTTVKQQLLNTYPASFEHLDVQTKVISQVACMFRNFDTNTCATQRTSTSPPALRKLKQLKGVDSSPVGQSLDSDLHRQLQQDGMGLLVSFNMTVEVRADINFIPSTMKVEVLRTFDNKDKRNAFINALTDTAQSEEFNRINQLEVEIDGQKFVKVLSPKLSTNEKGISFYVPIAAGALGFILLIGGFIWWRRKPEVEIEAPMSFNADDFAESQRTFDNRLASTIEVDREDQDISTLGDPQPAHNPVFGAFGAHDINDSQSAPSTGGFDFNRAYGGAAGDDDVSSAAGKQSANSPGWPLIGGRANPAPAHDEISSSDQSTLSRDNVSLFTDDQSFERMYGVEDERIEITAPAGKLGVVIDTPLSGNPIVHAIKDTSVLADQVQLGDKLVSMDGIDTTQMSAMKVSKLISSKAQNQRILVFHRTPVPPS